MENKICLPQEKIGQIKDICRSFDNDRGELINVLHRTQGVLGYLPREVQQLIAAELGMTAAEVYGVVSFYSFFSMTPKGKYPISICMGTACYVRGAQKVLEEFMEQLGLDGVGKTTDDGLFSLDSLRCVGACGLAPVAMVGEKVFGRLTPDSVDDILKKYYAKEAALKPA